MSRRVKIVATVGPASDSPETLRQLIDAGVDVVRLNFSHGSHEEHRRRFEAVRAAAAGAGRVVAVLQDLQGPKIRTGPLAGAEPLLLREGARLVLVPGEVPGETERVGVSYPELARDVAPGDPILLADGAIRLEVTEVAGDGVVTRVREGGELAARQGVHLPGGASRLRLPTGKDARDLAFGLGLGVDFVAVSFVRRAADLRAVRELVAEQEQDTPLVAKIEKREALESLDEIVAEADAVMVARGDLGVEMEPERVPMAQKRIVAAAMRAGRPVIVATQMLESMIERSRPTRAEASDVANAILDGADAVMLSGETAVGHHPVESVLTMVRIAADVEQASDTSWTALAARELGDDPSDPATVCDAVAAIAREHPRLRAVWVLTWSGATARLVAQRRPHLPILAFTPSEATWRRLALSWGVRPIRIGTAESFEALEPQLAPLARELGLARPGDPVVVTGSQPFGRGVPTNFLKLARA